MYLHRCPFCEAALMIPDAAVGTRFVCPACDAGFVVPARVRNLSDPAAAAPTAAAPVGPPARDRPRRLGRVAAAVVLVGLGGVGGFLLARQFPTDPGSTAASAAGEPPPVAPPTLPPAVATHRPVAPSPRLVAQHRPIAPALRLVDRNTKVPPAWAAVRFVSGTAEGGGRIESRPDGSLVVTGPDADRDRYTLVLDSDLPVVGALRLEALPDPALPGGGPGRAGNFVLTELGVAAGADKPAAVRLAGAEATFSQEGCDVGAAIDGIPFTGWAIAPRAGERHAAVFRFAEPVRGAPGVRLTVTLDQQYGGKHTLGRFRITVAGP